MAKSSFSNTFSVIISLKSTPNKKKYLKIAIFTYPCVLVVLDNFWYNFPSIITGIGVGIIETEWSVIIWIGLPSQGPYYLM